MPHRSIRSALLIYLAGIPVRIGFDSSAGARFFTHRVHYEKNIHEIERNLKLLTPLQIYKNGRELPDLFIRDNDAEAVNEWLSRNKISEQKNIVAFAPGSVWPTKRWPAVYWGKLIDKFAEEGYEVILIGSAQDS
ncbi:MAG: glycosyltransferase family 9 protein, partial [Calditrichia bacterium]